MRSKGHGSRSQGYENRHAAVMGKMRACGDAGLQFRVSRLRVRDKVRVSVRDRVGVRVSDGVRVSTFYRLSH